MPVLRRVFQLNLGIALMGFSIALMLQTRLGLDPWTVFHQGIAHHTGFSIGQVIILTGIIVTGLSYFLLRQQIGLGTLLNVFAVGLWIDFFSSFSLIPFEALSLRVAGHIVGIALLGFSTAVYIRADFGAGPRDMLVLGVSKRSGQTTGLTRTVIELFVLVAGFLLGGQVGVGTILFAVSIGWFMHRSLDLLSPTIQAPG